MFDSFIYERKIYRLLKRLSRQRVQLVIKPENVWLIDRALAVNEENEALLYTCQMRGWIEILHESVPHGSIETDGSINKTSPFDGTQHIWKLTDSGWATIQRRHAVSVFSLTLTALGVALAVVAQAVV
ncbi:TPA: hypothetical protein ACVOYM_003417 [Vibrio diabolicus]|nr:hypothetical protein [Vibrio alginolyticus]